MHRFLCLPALLVLIAGCDRPVVDLAPPRVEVVFPQDLSVVQTDPLLDLAIRAEVFGDIDSVAVGGRATTFDNGRNVYEVTLSLVSGINVLPVEIYDVDGLRGTDTLFVLQAAPQPVSPPVSGSPSARAGAAASSLPSGDVFLSGGISRTGTAIGTGTRISVTGDVLGFSDVPLNEARSGHSSTVLPDGRVLLLGGARAEVPLQLAETAEAIDLETETSTTFPIVTEQGTVTSISRTGHTARLLTIDGVLVIYLYGGVNALGIPLSTVDVLRVDSNDGLTLISPPGGAGSFPAFALPTQAPIGSRGTSLGSAVVFGLPQLDGDPTAFTFDWLEPSGLRFPLDLAARTAAPLSTPRTSAATVFVNGLVFISGGLTADGTTLNTFEVYAPSVNRTFRFPDSVRLRVPRSDHTATLLPGGRILIAGGRTTSGDALFAIEAFQL
ncbi:MAG: kelch repeat-containing protein [Bacteroidota bacterium]